MFKHFGTNFTVTNLSLEVDLRYSSIQYNSTGKLKILINAE